MGMAIKEGIKSLRSFKIIENFSHSIQFADSVEFGDATHIAEAVETQADVNQAGIVALQGAVLEQQFSLNNKDFTLTRFSSR
jgi:hypothetical protein